MLPSSLVMIEPGCNFTTAIPTWELRQRKDLPTPQNKDAYELARDRAVGCLIGLAVGDALGTTLEFSPRDSQPELTDMIGGGPFHLPVGCWTDDSAQALALADSLLINPDLDERDLMDRFVDWHANGTYSCTGDCFDVGMATAEALHRYKTTGNPIAGSSDPLKAGNGGSMRAAPVPILHHRNRTKMADVAARQSMTTHAAPEAVTGCVALCEVIADALEGMPLERVLRARTGDFAGEVASVMAGSWRTRSRGQISSSGYIVHTLEAALWCVGTTDTFADAVLTAANLGDDADTTSSVAGMLAGAIYGASGIPQHWRHRLAWSEHIADIGLRLRQRA